jgi:hypothetical protein
MDKKKHMAHDAKVFGENNTINVIIGARRKRGGVNKILMMQMLQWGSQCHFSPQVANVGAFYIIVVEMFLRLL